MMYPPIFKAVDTPAVRAFLGDPNGDLRFYLFAQAPQKRAYPYAVWRLTSGTPENYLGNLPDMDTYSTSIDIYVKPEASKPAETARAIAKALRDAIEPVAVITGWRGESRDPQTQNYVFSFDVDWHTPR